MKRLLISIFMLALVCELKGQGTEKKISSAFSIFENDPQLKHATISLFVVDAETGKPVFDKNSSVGLAPASTQKIITSVTAFELLGKDFRYKTELAHDGKIVDGVLNGNLYVSGSGDPTLGSWRYSSTKEVVTWQRWVDELKKKGIRNINGLIIGNDGNWESQTIPGGWMWDDMGNYYGAGSSALNWRENQYDLILIPGNQVGAPATIKSTDPELHGITLTSELTTGKKGSGDNAYIYLPPYSERGFVRGTIPLGESPFKISGSVPDPGKQLITEFSRRLKDAKFTMIKGSENLYGAKEKTSIPKNITNIYSNLSPKLDSIIFWFNRRSINLYGESLLKTIAFEKTGFGRTDSGIAILQKFWGEKGISDDELNMYDGSGLSPLNRVTTNSQVIILRHARSQGYFKEFYDALPEYNGMKMKSGTINGVKGFCGYQKSAGGKEYIFSFLVNNYNGSASSLVNKMYKVLDTLK